MSTVDYSRGAGQSLVAQGANRVLMLTREIDFSVTANLLIDADKGKVFDLPALSVVSRVVAQVVTSEAGVGAIGTVSNDDAFLNKVDFATLGYYHTGGDITTPVSSAGQGLFTVCADETKIDDVLLSGEDLYIMASGTDQNSMKVRVSALVEDWDFPATLI